MADYLRRLNEAGISQFAEYLSGGATGSPPLQLLSHPDTSEPLADTIKLADRDYPNRYEFGRDLAMRLNSLDPATISNDRGLWTWLALYLFEKLCPPGSDGKRKLDKQYRYILSSDYRHYYRHLVRTPWQLSRDHGPNSRFLLLATSDAADPLRRHGDILEQLGGTQSIIRSRPIIAEASRLYSDPISGRPRRGAAGKGGGSIRRFARVLRQLDLTFDPELMPPGGLSAILPIEFNSWKKSVAKAVHSSTITTTSTTPP
ncbi:hypothetical protein [Bradyrhizobium sp.]|uniref:hypothetical protein n=1 Tax=Bradyrhizobium sp. TaxID=376 RepID=UPI002716705D|nr:hypothetical protein [Bradyrhizobium sp.]MDO9296799.1 hypothetical protein [Bradyrhizobium sp.]